MKSGEPRGLEKPVLETLAGHGPERPPIWLMRQAGRYLPEYRALRTKTGSFLDLCFQPAVAAELTLQPISRFGFDAAILFSDILIIPHALGLSLDFLEGSGPRLQTLDSADDINRLDIPLDPARTLPVYEAVSLVRASLPKDVTLIGFVGGPWTVATYIAAGGTSRDHREARLWAYRDPVGFERLIGILVRASVDHLSAQIKAGAEVVQIFDSWAGVLPLAEFRRWCVSPLVRITQELRARHPNVPVIVFPRGAGSKLQDIGEDLRNVAIGLDTAEDVAAVSAWLDPDVPVQGNLDPLALIAGGSALDAAIDDVLQAFDGRNHIFNLGHGILPETPIAHVEQLVARVRGRQRL